MIFSTKAAEVLLVFLINVLPTPTQVEAVVPYVQAVAGTVSIAAGVTALLDRCKKANN